MSVSPTSKAQQRQAAIRIIILAAIILCVNALASRFHYGLDLTREKRFTLSPSTKKLLRNMDDEAVVTVYLEGKGFSSDLQRMRAATAERLQSFRDVAGKRVVYSFTDPFAGAKSDTDKIEIYKKLESQGVIGVPIGQRGEGKMTTQIIFPYALVQYKGRSEAVSLVENHLGMSTAEMLNYSESLLEYKLATAINHLSRPDKPRVAYIMGNGEPLGADTYDALSSLNDQYHLDTVDINYGTQISAAYDAAIICKPIIPFTEKQKFRIDQYVMRGGKILWMLDGVDATMDSLAHGSEQFLATSFDLKLDDLLFKYGVRINPDLVQDLQCNRIPVTVGMVNNEPRIEQLPWIYFPVFVPSSHHPIVANMDAVMSIFASSIDTIANPEIKKTVLLESSQYSRTTPAPVRVSLSELRFAPKPELFNKPYRPVSVLLEGRFQSVFQDRLSKDFLQVLRDSLHQEYKAAADSAGAMIVTSDGDMMLNDFSAKEGPMEMGYWRFEKARYANKNFFLNCIEYLTDRSGLLEARSKDVRLRLLDGKRVLRERTTWQTVNIVFPVGIVLLFAVAYLFFRQRRYA